MNRGPVRWGTAAYGLFVLLLGVFVAVETARLSVGPAYAAIGPRLFPALVATGLILAGLGVLVMVLRSRHHPAPTPPPRLDRRPLVLITMGLALQMLLLEQLGFVLASAILFFVTTQAFGGNHWLRGILAALLLPLLIHIAFTRGLGLPLPAGLLSPLL
ncbi:MAG TPA: tripartite tricarboxylate transporter TctB family protein [Azospirillaceae bacterium]|nr:tripartite tricarboxylate transporter TctB family protein [Azospirillaceae bacterium]